MTDSVKFKLLKLSVHILSILTALISFILLGFLVYNNKLMIIESKIPNFTVFKLSQNLLITALLNLSTSFFASCAISSKFKPYMTAFSFYVLVNMCVILFYIIYSYYMSAQDFSGKIREDKVSGATLISLIPSYFGEAIKATPEYPDLNENSVNFISLKYEFCINFYLGNLIFLLLINISLYLLLTFAAGMNYYEYKERVPNIVYDEEVGLNSAFVRNFKFKERREEFEKNLLMLRSGKTDPDLNNQNIFISENQLDLDSSSSEDEFLNS